jgi:hypothetical protein
MGPVTVYSDSTCALLGEKITRTRKPNNADRDLWLELIAATSKRSAPITWTKAKAHSGIAQNEYVDRLAKAASRGSGGQGGPDDDDFVARFWWSTGRPFRRPVSSRQRRRATDTLTRRPERRRGGTRCGNAS